MHNWNTWNLKFGFTKLCTGTESPTYRIFVSKWKKFLCTVLCQMYNRKKWKIEIENCKNLYNNVFNGPELSKNTRNCIKMETKYMCYYFASQLFSDQRTYLLPWCMTVVWCCLVWSVYISSVGFCRQQIIW